MAGTLAVITVVEIAVNGVSISLNRTATTSTKFVPWISTEVPATPFVGEKLVTIGRAGGSALVTVKNVVLAFVLVVEKTVIGPVVALVGTIAEIKSEKAFVKTASAPLNLTLITAVRFVPWIKTVAPAAPLVGEKSVMLGGSKTVNEVVLVAWPLGVVTVIGPLTALVGTVAKTDAASTLNAASTPLNFTEVVSERFGP